MNQTFPTVAAAGLHGRGPGLAGNTLHQRRDDGGFRAALLIVLNKILPEKSMRVNADGNHSLGFGSLATVPIL